MGRKEKKAPTDRVVGPTGGSEIARPDAEVYDLDLEAIEGRAGSSQWRLASWVPPGSRVLDVGCAAGVTARLLRQRKGCQVVGVEASPNLAEKARAVCAEVHEGDVEDPGFLERLPGDFDAILLGDVLEHLRRPDVVLAALSRHLAREGVLLISLPNVANWRVRARLLCGRFDYTDSGLLDRTHLRFFTRRSARELIEKAGFRLLAESWTAGGGRRLPTLLARLVPGLFAYQLLFRAVRRDPENPGANRDFSRSD